jgi:hypothetical protein
MPLDLPLRCRCGRVRGVASNVSPSSGQSCSAVDARARSADAVLRRSHKGTVCRAARAHAERARRSLTRLVARFVNSAGYNFRRLIRWLKLLMRTILIALFPGLLINPA